MSWAEPYLLLGLLFIPVMWWVYMRRLKRFSVLYPLAGREAEELKWWQRVGGHGVMVFYTLALGALVLALARPQMKGELALRKGEGLDIMLVVDTSESMKQRDLMVGEVPVNRLEAVREVVRDFIRKRVEDRLGLVIFGSEAFAQAPLTLDHEVLVEFLEDMTIGMAGPKTAIGDGIGVASNRLMSSASPSRVMILLTDGANTAGTVDPLQAAEAAKSLGIKIYTIGVAGKGELGFLNLRLSSSFLGSDVDEATLKSIAEITGGRYFYAQDTESLREVYETINTLERHTVEQEAPTIDHEVFHGFAWSALVAFTFMFLCAALGLGRLP